jgi:DNA repair ATPase RecN
LSDGIRAPQAQRARKDPQRYYNSNEEQVKEYTTELNKMRREFQRECMKLEMNDKKMNKDLKKMLNGNTPQVLPSLCRPAERHSR